MDVKRSPAILDEPLEQLVSRWPESRETLGWSLPFVLPPWLKAWWDSFGHGWESHVLTVESEGRRIGVAPLRIRGQEARIIGDVNVCDYLDFIAEPGREEEFLTSLVGHLRQLGVRRLDLRVLRPESTAARFLPDVARKLAWETSIAQEDVSYELRLPSTWDEYLAGLSRHQRHEIRRKLRRLEDTGKRVELRVVDGCEAVRASLGTFLELFRGSRPDKAEFMDRPMTEFFQSVIDMLAAQRMLRLYFLDMDSETAAGVLCFERGATTYLYNNGFDPRFSSLSIGMLSKLLTIRECIERGQKVYDFLKGSEPYKRHLGGEPVPLFRCRVKIS
jgi:CelD/BcsL family acetyltransferase involved in cellulose biosynthesis